MNKFKKLRLLSGKTVEQIAKALEVNKASVYKWETGQYSPNASKIEKMAKVYKCSVEAIVEAYEAQN